jgi:hypothetical protein
MAFMLLYTEGAGKGSVMGALVVKRIYIFSSTLRKKIHFRENSFSER